MISKLIFSLVIFLFSLNIIFSQGQNWRPLNSIFENKQANIGKSDNTIQYLDDIYNYDVLHYEIHIDVTDTISKRIFANVIITARPTENDFTVAVFDLDNSSNSLLFIDSILFSDKNFTNYQLNQATEMNWVNSRARCTIPETLSIADTFSLNIYYQGWTKIDESNWPYGGLGFDNHDGIYIIETISEPESAHNWWPCKDVPNDKATADIYITTGRNQLAASNGLLQSKTDIPGNKTVHWWKENYPITTYLIAITVTNYTLLTQSYTSLDSSKTMPIMNFVYPEKVSAAEYDFSRVPEMIRALALKFGEYPFINEKYGNAMANIPGMEHQTISAMGADYIDGSGSAEDWLVIHELAHHWLGDQVTCATWKDTWLNEGGASYLESIWQEYKGGEDAYISHMADFLNDALAADQPLCGFSPPFDIGVYHKGAWVYHMLRYYMGDSLFFSSMKKYLNESPYSYGSATSQQFIAYLEEVSGKDLSVFQDEWIMKGGCPYYGFAYNIVNQPDGSSLKIQVSQIQPLTDIVPIFNMPIPVMVTFEDNKDTLLYLNDSLHYQVFSFSFNKKLQTSLSLDNFNYKEKILCQKLMVDYNSVQKDLAGDLELEQVYPNPFFSSFNISFTNNTASAVVIDLYDILGNKIYSKNLGYIESGTHQAKISPGTDLSPGYYMLVIRSGSEAQCRKLIKGE
jgi:aminopeptidase N